MQHKNLLLIIVTLLFLNTLNAQSSFKETSSKESTNVLNLEGTKTKQNKDLDWQFSIFGFVSPITSITESKNTIGFGGLLEFGIINKLPNLSTNLGYTQYRLHKYVGYRTFEFVDSKGVTRIITSNDLSSLQAKGNNIALRLNYHFLPEKKVRPFLLGGVGRITYKSSPYIDPDIMSLGGAILTEEDYYTTYTYQELFGLGLDINLKGFHLIRLEGTYSKGVELKIAYGININ